MYAIRSYYALAALGIEPWRPTLPAVIGMLSPQGPAERAGLQTGDRVLRIAGEPVADWAALVRLVRARPGQATDFDIERAGQLSSLRITPAEQLTPDGERYGFIGAGVQTLPWPDSMLRRVQHGPLDALWVGAQKTGQMIGLTLDSIGKMIVGAISVKNLSGPITIRNNFV